MLNVYLNPRERIIKTMVTLQENYPFFSYILMHFKIEPGEAYGIPTIAVDIHGNLYYNTNFISTKSTAELEGLLVHETMHIAKGDFTRQENREASIWNIASDAIINYILIQEGFILPQGIVPDHSGNIQIANKRYNVRGKITEEFYDELVTNAEEIEISINGDGDGDGDGNGKETEEEGGQNNEGGSSKQKKFKNHGNFDVHIEEKTTAAEKAKQAGKWRKITVEAATNAQARGKLPGCAVSLVDKILNPVIDWRSRIQRFITNEIPVDFTNRLPSRKFYGTGVWSPRVLRENIDVFVSVDVSGSTSADRQYFINEIAGILSSYEQIKARIIFWDYVVKEENDFLITGRNRDELLNLKIVDCDGGTRLSSYAEYCEQKGYKSHIHIILTDGEVENTPILPSGEIIFVLTKNGTDSVVKDFGAVCKLSDVEE